jgi:hypothetical protein
MKKSQEVASQPRFLTVKLFFLSPISLFRFFPSMFFLGYLARDAKELIQERRGAAKLDRTSFEAKGHIEHGARNQVFALHLAGESKKKKKKKKRKKGSDCCLKSLSKGKRRKATACARTPVQVAPDLGNDGLADAFHDGRDGSHERGPQLAHIAQRPVFDITRLV